jgi:hypothetical protein
MIVHTSQHVQKTPYADAPDLMAVMDSGVKPAHMGRYVSRSAMHTIPNIAIFWISHPTFVQNVNLRKVVKNQRLTTQPIRRMQLIENVSKQLIPASGKHPPS